MNEIPKILEPREKVAWESKPRYAAYMVWVFFGGIVGGGVGGFFVGMLLNSLVVGLIVGIAVFAFSLFWGNLAYNVTHYAITNKRVILQKGVIGRDFRSIEYDKIQNASVNVGLIGVIFHVGRVNMFTGELISTGGKHPHLRPKYDTLRYVRKPYDVLKLLQRHLSSRKEKLYGGKY